MSIYCAEFEIRQHKVLKSCSLSISRLSTAYSSYMAYYLICIYIDLYSYQVIQVMLFIKASGLEFRGT